MIRFNLTCDKGHAFESWFKSSDACDGLLASGMVACVDCGSSKVTKALMAPAVRVSDKRPLTTPADPREAALAKLRDEVEANSEYVGMGFVAEARAMHTGDAPERAIHGEARIDEAIQLLEEGVPVAPLPFTPRKRTN